MSYLKRLCE